MYGPVRTVVWQESAGDRRPYADPDRQQRDLRDLTRYRARLSDDCGQVAARVEKVLEDANIKLAAVASDVLGASGRAMLRAMVAGEEDAERLADLAKLRLRQKLPELRVALQGRVRDHHRFLLQHGVLRSSFVPDQQQRDLRDLTRYRARLSDDCGRVAARVEKVLEDANIKLAAVASDVLGASGRAMLRAMIAGEEDPERLAELAKLRLRQKLPELRTALAGRVREHHRFLLRQLLDELEFLEGKLEALEQRIGEQMHPFERAVTLWKTIPGISDVTAWSLVAEIGVRTEQFASGQHLASWAGMCPGNHESAGKRYSGKTRKGNRWLRRILNQAAWAVSRSKNSYLAARYRRFAARRGKKRAIVAIGHKLLVIAYTLLQRGCEYRDLGADYFDRLHRDGLVRSLVRRIERLGHSVVRQPA